MSEDEISEKTGPSASWPCWRLRLSNAERVRCLSLLCPMASGKRQQLAWLTCDGHAGDRESRDAKREEDNACDGCQSALQHRARMTEAVTDGPRTLDREPGDARTEFPIMLPVRTGSRRRNGRQVARTVDVRTSLVYWNAVTRSAEG